MFLGIEPTRLRLAPTLREGLCQSVGAMPRWPHVRALARRRPVQVAGAVCLASFLVAGRLLIVEQPIDAPDLIVMLTGHEWERLPATVLAARANPQAAVVISVPIEVDRYNCHRCGEQHRVTRHTKRALVAKLLQDLLHDRHAGHDVVQPPDVIDLEAWRRANTSIHADVSTSSTARLPLRRPGHVSADDRQVPFPQPRPSERENPAGTRAADELRERQIHRLRIRAQPRELGRFLEQCLVELKMWTFHVYQVYGAPTARSKQAMTRHGSPPMTGTSACARMRSEGPRRRTLDTRAASALRILSSG